MNLKTIIFICNDILNESETEELLSIIDQIERNVLGHPENKKEMDSNFPYFVYLR